MRTIDRPYLIRYSRINRDLKPKGSLALSSAILSLIIHLVFAWVFLHAMFIATNSVSKNNKPVEVNLVSLAPTPTMPNLPPIATQNKLPDVQYKQQPDIETKPEQQILPMELPKTLPKLLKQEKPPEPHIEQYQVQKVAQIKYTPQPEIKSELAKSVTPTKVKPITQAPVKIAAKTPPVPHLKRKIYREAMAVRYRRQPRVTARPVVDIQPVKVAIAAGGNISAHYNPNLPISKGSAGSNIPPSVLAAYKTLVRERIEEHKLYPLSAREKGIQGDVWVNFVLSKDGKLKKIRVVKSSLYRSLDAAALKSIEASNPFPPFPKEIKTDKLSMVVCIRFKLQQE